MSDVKKHAWLTLHSTRTQPYTIEDISIVIPSAAGKYEQRWKWFWPQYVAKTDPRVVANTIVPCDEEEVSFLRGLGVKNTVVVKPRWIVYKTLGALDNITTRLMFRLANDIMVVREGWEQILLDQFNAQEKLQIIAEVQHGASYPENHTRLSRDLEYFRREYPQVTTAAVYPHGSRIFTQSAVWRAYYGPVLRYTPHDHDELFFSQLARGDGTVFCNFRGINLYLAHKGISNKDFTEEDFKKIEADRKSLEEAEDKHIFTIMP